MIGFIKTIPLPEQDPWQSCQIFSLYLNPTVI